VLQPLGRGGAGRVSAVGVGQRLMLCEHAAVGPNDVFQMKCNKLSSVGVVKAG